MTTTTAGEIIEHIVLFKMKPDTDPSKINESIAGLNSLSSLPQVLYLTAAPIHSTHSDDDDDDLHFTHILHVRFKSKNDLATYTPHPSHLAVVQQTKPIVGDIMALDWVSAAKPDPVPGQATRVVFLKVKEKRIVEVLRVLGDIKDEYPLIDQFSIGENFSLDRAKGFSVGMIMVFPAASGLDLDLGLKEKLGDGIESSVVVDYLIPAPESQAAGE